MTTGLWTEPRTVQQLGWSDCRDWQTGPSELEFSREKDFSTWRRDSLGFFNEHLVQQMTWCCAHKNGFIDYHHCWQMSQEICEAQKSPAQTLGHLSASTSRSMSSSRLWKGTGEWWKALKRAIKRLKRWKSCLERLGLLGLGREVGQVCRGVKMMGEVGWKSCSGALALLKPGGTHWQQHKEWQRGCTARGDCCQKSFGSKQCLRQTSSWTTGSSR